MSKKQSDAKGRDKRLESLVFFVDRCLGSNDVPQALAAAGMRVERHRDHFNSDADDCDWLPEVGRRGWIVVTKDAGFRSRQIEVKALINAGVPTFVLASGSTTGPQNGAAIVAAIPQILRFVGKFPAPFIAQITAMGAVSLVLTHEGILRRLD